MSDFGFGLKDCKIAQLTDPDVPTYATAVDVEAIQMLGVTLNFTSAELEGDDEIVDSHSKPIKANVQMRFGFSRNHIDVWAVLVGATAVDSGDDKFIVIGTTNPEYFGICGKVDHTSGGGDLHIWIPQCKLMDGLSLTAQYGQYQTPDLTVTALKLNDTQGIFVPIEHEVAIPVAIPPVFGAA